MLLKCKINFNDFYTRLSILYMYELSANKVNTYVFNFYKGGFSIVCEKDDRNELVYGLIKERMKKYELEEDLSFDMDIIDFYNRVTQEKRKAECDGHKVIDIELYIKNKNDLNLYFEMDGEKR